MSKQPQTKLGAACRALAVVLRDPKREFQFDLEAHQLDRAGANLDQAAISLDAKGPRVKTLGSYYAAHQLYQSVADRTGNPKYEG